MATLTKSQRAIVIDILAQQTGNKEWRQDEQSVAVAKAAFAFAQTYAKADAKVREGLSWTSFATEYGEGGFLANVSQFQQVLDSLDVKDACYVKRPKKTAKVSKYV